MSRLYSGLAESGVCHVSSDRSTSLTLSLDQAWALLPKITTGNTD